MVAAFMNRRLEPLRSPEEVAGLSLPPEEDRIFRACQRSGVLGTPEQCAEKISDIAKRYTADEVMLVSITYEFEARLRSYQLLARALGLGPAVAG
jgi:alkanesulfonate monooxygenase SsuD/methylene tetrahydromethanopterin reductase-like flavin-dependent oxidoreductase (luciferase family)